MIPLNTNTSFREWKVYSPTFEIQKYSIDFTPFINQLKLDSHFEIVGNFNLPPDSLFVNYHFPNQTIERAYLNFLPNKKCTAKYHSFSSCYSFKSNSYLNLTSDSYFSREISSPLSVPFSLSFDLDSANLSNLQIKDKNTSLDNQNYFSFISNLQNKNISSKFNYQNTFNLSRDAGENEYKKIKIPFKWRISSNKSRYFYHPLTFKLNDYDSLISTPIIDWLSIHKHSLKQVKIDELIPSIIFESDTKSYDLSLTPSLFDQKENDTSLILSYKGSLKKENKDYLENKTSSPGILLPWNSHGYLQTKISLLLDNVFQKFNLSNSFHFKSELKSNINEALKIKITNKEGDYSEFLKSAKYILFSI